VDVGANVGQFAVAAAKFFPNVRILSFEPMPASLKKLRENLAGLINVTIYPIALGATDGTVELRVNSHSHSSSLLPLAECHQAAFPEAREIGTLAVKVSTLDIVLKDVELTSPVMLKLDVQGFEAMTLRGGGETLKRMDYVVLEGSFKPLYEGEVLFIDLVRMMEGYGFKFRRPVGSLEDPITGEVLQMDLLFDRSK
jgi:FkbM family methyltransferase